jgi:hypothetical protein
VYLESKRKRANYISRHWWDATIENHWEKFIIVGHYVILILCICSMPACNFPTIIQGNLNSLEFPLYFSVQIILILFIWLSSLFSKFQNIPCLIWDDDDHDVFVGWLIGPFHTFFFYLLFFVNVVNIWPFDHPQKATIFLENFEKK